MSVYAYTWAFEQPINKSGPKFVLVALANFANEDGGAYPSQDTLAAMTGMSIRAVRGHLAWLEQNEYIKRSVRKDEYGHRKSDMCTLLAPPDKLKPQPAESSARNPNRQKTSIPTGKKRQSQPAESAGETLVEPSEDTLVKNIKGAQFFDETMTKCAEELVQVKNFPKDEIHSFLSELRSEYPSIDAVTVCRDYRVYCQDKPYQRPRAGLRTFFKNANERRTNGNGFNRNGPKKGDSHRIKNIRPESRALDVPEDIQRIYEEEFASND